MLNWYITNFKDNYKHECTFKKKVESCKITYGESSKIWIINAQRNGESSKIEIINAQRYGESSKI